MSGTRMNFEKYVLPVKVLEAGGHIESRCSIKEMPDFQDHYVFTKESLQQFMENLKNEQRN